MCKTRFISWKEYEKILLCERTLLWWQKLLGSLILLVTAIYISLSHTLVPKVKSSHFHCLVEASNCRCFHSSRFSNCPQHQLPASHRDSKQQLKPSYYLQLQIVPFPVYISSRTAKKAPLPTIAVLISCRGNMFAEPLLGNWSNCQNVRNAGIWLGSLKRIVKKLRRRVCFRAMGILSTDQSTCVCSIFSHMWTAFCVVSNKYSFSLRIPLSSV